MRKQYGMCNVLNIIAMITGVQNFAISPRKITLYYTDGTTETYKGKHPFPSIVVDDPAPDFDPYKVTSFVQSQRGGK